MCGLRLPELRETGNRAYTLSASCRSTRSAAESGTIVKQVRYRGSFKFAGYVLRAQEGAISSSSHDSQVHCVAIPTESSSLFQLPRRTSHDMGCSYEPAAAATRR